MCRERSTASFARGRRRRPNARRWPMPPSYELPDYREKSPDVADRFARIYQRPVVMEVQNLGKTFSTAKGETCALNNISFKVHRREFICVIGASGCGKSTLIRILAGLDFPTSGAV